MQLPRLQTEQLPWPCSGHVQRVGERNFAKREEVLDASIGEDARAGQECCAGDDNTAGRQHFQLLVPFAVTAGRQTGEATGIARKDRPSRRFHAMDAAQHGGRQMLAVANDTGPQFIGGELFPEIVIVPRKHGVRAVAQVRRETRAGGDGSANASARRRRMAKRNDDAGSCEFFDERQTAVQFGSQCDQANTSPGGILKAAKFVPVRRSDMAPRMRSARPILGTDVRSFQMHGRECAGKVSVRFTGAMDRSEAVKKCFARIGDERRAQSADAVAAADRNNAANIVFAQLRRIEADSVAAVYLQIE